MEMMLIHKNCVNNRLQMNCMTSTMHSFNVLNYQWWVTFSTMATTGSPSSTFSIWKDIQYEDHLLFHAGWKCWAPSERDWSTVEDWRSRAPTQLYITKLPVNFYRLKKRGKSRMKIENEAVIASIVEFTYQRQNGCTSDWSIIRLSMKHIDEAAGLFTHSIYLSQNSHKKINFSSLISRT